MMLPPPVEPLLEFAPAMRQSDGVGTNSTEPADKPTTPRVGSRREANKLDKLERIIAAARTEFHAKGFDQAKLSDVAHAAGVAKGTLFLYARSKEELLWLVFDRDTRPALMASLDGDPSMPLQDRLVHHFAAVAEQHNRHPEHSLIVAKELTWTRPVSEATKAFIGEWDDALEAIFAVARDRGEIDAGSDCRRLAQITIDAYYGAARAWLTQEESFESSWDRFLYAIRLIVAGSH